MQKRARNRELICALPPNALPRSKDNAILILLIATPTSKKKNSPPPPRPAPTKKNSSRAAQAAEKGGNEKESVKAYFNEVGFERWSRIYSDSDDVNKVQRDIREGHAITVDKVLAWLQPDARAGTSICDAGCGTGSLAIPLALKGAAVTATDISAAMAGEAEKRYKDAISSPGAPPAPPVAPTFEAKCLEDVEGKYDVVCCIDVLIHYPQEKVDEMLGNLASRAGRKIVVSFAPSTPYYEVLKRVGELFPKGAKATRAYLHKEEDVEAALQRKGWKVVRKEMTGTKFYFSRLFEAVPV